MMLDYSVHCFLRLKALHEKVKKSHHFLSKLIMLKLIID